MGTISSEYDRIRDLKAFDEAKLGVKGLVDTGLSKVLKIFINHQEDNKMIKQQSSPISDSTLSQLTIPSLL